MLYNVVKLCMQAYIGEVIGEIGEMSQSIKDRYVSAAEEVFLHINVVGTVFMYIAFNIQCKL